MAQAKANLNTYRQSPRKVRVVADLVRGKKVREALDILAFAPKRAAKPIEKLISSAVANAKNLSLEAEKLVVKEIRVDEGRILYRRMPTARGRAFPMRKRTSHVSVTLEEREPKVKKSKNKAK
jgi:large subunit ribosomal protein L22